MDQRVVFLAHENVEHSGEDVVEDIDGKVAHVRSENCADELQSGDNAAITSSSFNGGDDNPTLERVVENVAPIALVDAESGPDNDEGGQRVVVLFCDCERIGETDKILLVFTRDELAYLGLVQRV